MNMKLIRNEKGFTLLELLLVLAITGAIGGTMVLTTTTIVKITPQSNDNIVALHQVHSAGYWITRDVQTAQIVDIAPPYGEFLQLSAAVTGAANSVITYQLEDTVDGLKKLMRVKDGASVMVAENIYYNPGEPDTSTKILDYQNNLLSFRICTKSGNVTVSNKYEAAQRVGASP
jgi:prepilin-type N-terminal cleavage/methylation domain-containing protein